MPSKGVQIYSYIAVPGAQIELSVPGQTITRDEQRVFHQDRLEIDKRNLQGTFNFTGTFQFRVIHNGQEIAKESVDVNTMTGGLESGKNYGSDVQSLGSTDGSRNHEVDGRPSLKGNK